MSGTVTVTLKIFIELQVKVTKKINELNYRETTQDRVAARQRLRNQGDTKYIVRIRWSA